MSPTDAPAELMTPCGRSFRRDITLGDHHHMAPGEGRTVYRGVPFLKLPVDVLIHMHLLHKAKPATVIEIGSRFGGSALWFADMIQVTGIEPHIVSVDIKVPKLRDPRITFLEGDATRLGDVLTDELLSKLPRPWLLSEDSAHFYDTTKGALDFFADHMQPGEYVVVEDGVVSESGDPQFARGPNHAVAAFLSERPDYEVDAALCDVFGYNVTGNPNGYLRRKA